MTARDLILGDLLRDAPRLVKPRVESADLAVLSPAVSAFDLEGLIERFMARLTLVKGEALRARTMDEARSAVAALCERWGVRGAACSTDPLVQELGAQELLAGKNLAVQVLDGAESENAWRSELRAASQESREPNAPWDLAITGCAGALAETGSVAFRCAPGRSRSGWLLCGAHLVVLVAEQIVPDLDSLFTGGGALDKSDLPRAITLVTGPSRTADIEQTLTVGVHGPGRFAALVIG